VNPAADGAIGLLGGSFDPIHAGHLRLAASALAQLQLAQVRFVPAGQAWQKGTLTDASHRAWMVRRSIASEPRFALDTCELDRPGPSYTVDTLEQLRAELGGRVPLVLLIGADQFERLDTWRRWERLIDLASIAVARRQGHAAQLSAAMAAFRAQRLQAPAQATRQPAGALVELAMAPFDCSSTGLRALLKQAAHPPPEAAAAAAAQAAPLLAPGVLDYIRQQRLYA
jgi:nicotinate-nucleotide adenylyltransferase